MRTAKIVHVFSRLRTKISRKSLETTDKTAEQGGGEPWWADRQLAPGLRSPRGRAEQPSAEAQPERPPGETQPELPPGEAQSTQAAEPAESEVVGAITD